MSTACALVFFASGLAGCAGGGDGSTVDGRRVLTADPETKGLSPGQSGSMRFILTSNGVPIGGQTVTFSILDPTIAQGATLMSSSAVTDATGVTTVVVRAGLETQFKVRAKSLSAEADATIFVAVGEPGSVVVVPFFGPSSVHAASTEEIEVRLLDGHQCRELVPAFPPQFNDIVRDAALLAKPGTPSPPFKFVRTTGSSAVVARALGTHGSAVAAGCVDVAGASLLGGEVVSVAVRLDDVIPDPIGTFEVTSILTLSPPLPEAVALAAAWRDLADCPLDPAQLLLDCTIDALSAPSAADPLDCVPASGAGAETVLGDALTAKRGTFITDLAGGTSTCRASVDANRAVSLDAVVLGLYGSPLPPPVAALPAVGEDAAHILDAFSLSSTLDVRPGVTPGSFLFNHRLVSAEFGPIANRVPVPLAPLGLPVLEAHAPGTTRDDLVFIDEHGFTFHLGTVAKSAFAKLALEPRGLTADPTGVVGKVAAALGTSDGAATGCAAMDRTLCLRVGAPTGCLIAACTAGLAALGARLDTAFDALDGAGLDLYLSGVAPPLDTHDNGLADQLGSFEMDAMHEQPNAGTWSAQIKTSAGRADVTGKFAGARP